MRMPKYFVFSIGALFVAVAAILGSLSPIQPPRPKISEVTEIALAPTTNQQPILYYASHKQDEATIKNLVQWLSEAALISYDKNGSLVTKPTGVQAIIVIGNVHNGKYIWLTPQRTDEVSYDTTLNNGVPAVLYSPQLYNWLTQGYKSSVP